MGFPGRSKDSAKSIGDGTPGSASIDRAEAHLLTSGMKQQPARSNTSLSSLRVPVLLSLFTANALLGLFAVWPALCFLTTGKPAWVSGGMVFLLARWWFDTALLLVFAVPGYFSLKVADGCAGELLNRLGIR